MINNRLCPLLPSLVNQDQSGFIKGRHIIDNIRLMFDIIDYAKCKNVSGAVLFVDLQKAFDSLNWSFILAMLRIYGFGDFLIGLIKMIYKEPKCCITNNNFLSSFFNVKRGVRQGNPLSPTIFDLSIEYLAILFRQSISYKGLTFQNHCFKISLFADDTQIYLNGNPSQFKHVFDILRIFTERSGCEVNIDKSTAFYIGSSRVNVMKPFSIKGLKWVTNTIKYFGVHILIQTCGINSVIDQNFSSINDKIKTELNIRSSRGLTLLGKISVLKSLIVPKIMFKAANLSVIFPDSYFKKINKVLFKFIWGSKWEKIGRSQLCCDTVNGEAKIIHIKQHMLALQFKGVVKLIDENYTAAWKTLENLCIDENLFFCILRSNMKMTL